jgi:hypothetical protein
LEFRFVFVILSFSQSSYSILLNSLSHVQSRCKPLCKRCINKTTNNRLGRGTDQNIQRREEEALAAQRTKPAAAAAAAVASGMTEAQMSAALDALRMPGQNPAVYVFFPGKNF